MPSAFWPPPERHSTDGRASAGWGANPGRASPVPGAASLMVQQAGAQTVVGLMYAAISGQELRRASARQRARPPPVRCTRGARLRNPRRSGPGLPALPAAQRWLQAGPSSLAAPPASHNCHYSYVYEASSDELLLRLEHSKRLCLRRTAAAHTVSNAALPLHQASKLLLHNHCCASRRLSTASASASAPSSAHSWVVASHAAFSLLKVPAASKAVCGCVRLRECECVPTLIPRF